MAAVSAPAPARATALLWFRAFDLRTDDHPALADAAASSTAAHLLPIYCLDEARELRPRRPSSAKNALPPTGPHRLRFRLEALADLRRSLAALGSGLVVRPGAPEDVLPRLLEQVVEADRGGIGGAGVSLVFHRRPPAPPLPGGDEEEEEEEDAEERRVAQAVAAACERLGLPPPTVRRHWGAATLHHPVSEVAAWLAAGGGEASASEPDPPPPASRATATLADADGADAAERLLMPRLLPDTFSAYRRALEAGAPRPSSVHQPPEKQQQKKEKSRPPQPPLRAWLPSSAPLDAPAGPLPPLPPPFCDADGDNHDDDNSHGALPRDTHDLYARAGPEGLEALRELSRLCGGGGDFASPGAVVPAYACGDDDEEQGEEGDEQQNQQQRQQQGGGAPHHPRADPRSAFPFVGGERAARARLDHVLASVLDPPPQPFARMSYGEARMMAAWEGFDHSAKLSPYIAAGCLSPRRVAAEALRHQRRVRPDGGGDGEDALWLLSHLVIRDWYVLSGWRESARTRRSRGGGGGGGGGGDAARGHWPAAFEAWAGGRSGASPFVDASMRELAATGWQSNRSRQVAASALAHDLLPPPPLQQREEEGEGEGEEGEGGDWAWHHGARLFEALLIDGDRSANRGNWRQVCARRFDAAAQAAKYDPEGRLERAWLP